MLLLLLLHSDPFVAIHHCYQWAVQHKDVQKCRKMGGDRKNGRKGTVLSINIL